MSTTGPSAPSLSKTYAKEMAAYNQYLPQILNTQNQNIGPNAAATLAATQQTQPGYNQLNLEQLQKYALPSALINQQVTDSNAQAGARTNLNQILGAGGQAATAAQSLTNSLNPSLGRANERSVEGLNAINLNGLSPGEQNAVERSLNQSNYGKGQLGIGNATNTVSNAMNYGGAFNSKLGLLNNAIGTATNAANASTAAINPASIALGQPNQSTSTFGTGANASTQQGSATNTFNGSNALMGMLGSNANSLAAPTTQANIAGNMVGSGGILAGVGQSASPCCFIFMEAYNGQLPESVRLCRDFFYKENDSLSNGYKRMAKWLVPAMKKWSTVRALVNFSMVKPLTYNGEWLCSAKGYGWIATPIRALWFSIWKLTSN